jgi:type IV secretory pathway VirJ component
MVGAGLVHGKAPLFRTLMIALALLLSGCVSLTTPQPVAQGVRLPLRFDDTPSKPGDDFVVWLTGVGGWGPADRAVTSDLGALGLRVVGLDCTGYFAHRRTPQEAAADLAALIDAYESKWGRPGVVLVGYSFGGAALPLILPDLPPEVRAHIRLVVLIAPSRKSQLVMRPWTALEMFQPGATPLSEEAGALDGLRSLCICDPKDPVAFCRSLPKAPEVEVRGGHLLRGSREAVAQAIATADEALPSA